MFDVDKAGRVNSTKYPPRTGPSMAMKAKKLVLRAFGRGKDEAEVQQVVEEDVEKSADIELQEEGGKKQEPIKLTRAGAIVVLVVATAFVAFTAECLVSSLDGMATSSGLSREFIGLILLPIVGNAAEHVTAVTVSAKDKLTLSISVAVGSAIVSSLLPPQPDVVAHSA